VTLISVPQTVADDQPRRTTHPPIVELPFRAARSQALPTTLVAVRPCRECDRCQGGSWRLRQEPKVSRRRHHPTRPVGRQPRRCRPEQHQHDRHLRAEGQRDAEKLREHAAVAM
jgi:hypothetical protein